LYDIAWSAAFHRDWHEHRAIVHCRHDGIACCSARKFASRRLPWLQLETGVALTSPATLAFVYSGNGSQWEGMGRRLLVEEPVLGTLCAGG